MISLPTTSASRRALLGGLVLSLAPAKLLAAPADRALRFAVFRNATHVGEHETAIVQAAGLTTATTSVAMVVRLGPLPVFRYSHQARETWLADRFKSLDTATTSNAKRDRVTARAAPEGVLIETAGGRTRASAAAAPLTHWNPLAFRGPLFNPQTGKLLAMNVRRLTGERLPDGSGPATRWSLRGESEIDDWYDDRGSWSALRGRLPDGSMLEYRRL